MKKEITLPLKNVQDTRPNLGTKLPCQVVSRSEICKFELKQKTNSPVNAHLKSAASTQKLKNLYAHEGYNEPADAVQFCYRLLFTIASIKSVYMGQLRSKDTACKSASLIRWAFICHTVNSMSNILCKVKLQYYVRNYT